MKPASRGRSRVCASARSLVRFALAACVAALALLASPTRALAHQVGVSSGTYTVDGADVRAELTFSRREIAAAVPSLDGDGDGVVTGDELAHARAALAQALVDGVDIRADGSPCARQLASADLVEGDGVSARLVARCPAGAASLRIDLALLEALPFGHRHVVHLAGVPHPTDAVLYRGSRAVDAAMGGAGVAPTGAAPAPPSTPVPGLFGFFRMGIEHILTGYDHLLFLFGLVLVGGRRRNTGSPTALRAETLRSLALAISAFTVAHSITLALAALGVWTPSSRIVEPAIALSIAYVGVENYFVRDAAKRWRITLPFGLVHGFGFASALREVGLARAQIPGALVSFNLGVEVGQLAVVAAIVPLLLWARKQPRFETAGVRALNAAVAVAGLAWFVIRIA